MQQPTIYIFEDESYQNFGPLTSLRSVWDLRTGAMTQVERFRTLFTGYTVSCYGRINIRNLSPSSDPISDLDESPSISSSTLFLNARLILNQTCSQQILEHSHPTLFRSKGQIVGAHVTHKMAAELIGDETGLIDLQNLPAMKEVEIDAELFDYPWNVIDRLEQTLSEDFNLFEKSFSCAPYAYSDDVTVREPHNVRVQPGVRIGAGVIIDAEAHKIIIENNSRIDAGAILNSSEGPIHIGPEARIAAGAIVQGPVYIGTNSIIRPGARLSSGISLGQHCRIGGEVSNSVMQEFSNKQHSGYLGTSYVGSWVNFGAATDNSDLKNNYRPITVSLNGRKVNSGSLHVGVVIGDFTRTAIHTRLNSGSIIGVCCNLFGADFPANEVPPFTWVSSDGYAEYRLDKALETIRAMMPRRARELTPELEDQLRSLFDNTVDERRSLTTPASN